MSENNYGVTFLESVGVYTIFSHEDNTMTWDEAVENLKWLIDNEAGF